MGGVHPHRFSPVSGRHVPNHHQLVARAAGWVTAFTLRTMGLAHSLLARSFVCRRGFPLLHQEGSGIQRLGKGRENEISAEGIVSGKQFPLSVAGVPGHERSLVHAQRRYGHSSWRSVDCATCEQRRRHQCATGRVLPDGSYPPAWPFHRPGGGAQNYNLSEAIRIRSAAHAFEGKVFNIVSSCALNADAIEQLSQGDSSMKELLSACPAPVSMIVGPNGELLGDPLVGSEGMVVAEVDIARSIEHKMAHDIVGHYNRFDIFHLEIDPTPNRPVWIKKPRQRDEEVDDWNQVPETEDAAQLQSTAATDSTRSRRVRE
jgi:hypothetical protein